MAPRICFFGDSFVNGTGDDDALGWVGRLCAAERRAGLDPRTRHPHAASQIRPGPRR